MDEVPIGSMKKDKCKEQLVVGHALNKEMRFIHKNVKKVKKNSLFTNKITQNVFDVLLL